MNDMRQIASDVSAVQSGIANGELTDRTAQEELNRIRKAALRLAEKNQRDNSPIIEGYRKDAVDQLRMLKELLVDVDLDALPDMELFHLSCCGELVKDKVYHYFRLRNGRAALGMMIGGA